MQQLKSRQTIIVGKNLEPPPEKISTESLNGFLKKSLEGIMKESPAKFYLKFIKMYFLEKIYGTFYKRIPRRVCDELTREYITGVSCRFLLIS